MNIKTIEIKNTEYISQLKKLVLEKYNTEKVRLFFGGKELSENQKILDYKIVNNCFIEIM
jgi:hypothetical protein